MASDEEVDESYAGKCDEGTLDHEYYRKVVSSRARRTRAFRTMAAMSIDPSMVFHALSRVARFNVISPVFLSNLMAD